MRRVSLLLPVSVPALLLGGAAESAACPSCFSQADGPLADGARAGIWLLLGLTLCLQGGFAAFFLYLRRRAARLKDDALEQEWSRLQREWDRADGSRAR